MTTSEPKRTPRLQLTCDVALKTSLDKIHRIHTGFRGDSNAAAVYAINAFADSIARTEGGDIPAAYAKFCDKHNLCTKVPPFSLLALVYGINFNDQRRKSKLWDHANYWGCSDGSPRMITIEPYYPDAQSIREFIDQCESLELVCTVGKEPSIHSSETTLIMIEASEKRDLNKAYKSHHFWLWFLLNSAKDACQGYQHPAFIEPQMKTFIDDLSRTINHHSTDQNLKLNSLLLLSEGCAMAKDCALVMRQAYLDCMANNHKIMMRQTYLDDINETYSEGDSQDSLPRKIRHRNAQLAKIRANRRLVQALNIELRQHGALISPYFENVVEYQVITAHTSDELPSNIAGAVMVSDDFFTVYDGYKLLDYLRARPRGTIDFNDFYDVINEYSHPT
jgi:hypothetical protein